MMKAKLLASILGVLALFAAYADDEYSVWDPNGSGGWSDATRWVGGKLPSSTKRVHINGDEAFATDDDYSILKSLTALRFSDNGSLDMRFDQDHDDFSLNSVMKYGGSAPAGTLIKSGAGVLVHESATGNFKPEKFIVTNGVLQLDYAPNGTIATNIFGAYCDGILCLNAYYTDRKSVV